MKKEKDQWIEAIAKLTKMTQENDLVWSIGELPEFFKIEKTVEMVYITKYKDKILRIYETRDKEYAFDLFTIRKEFTWTTRTVLDFIEPSGVSLWTFPEVQGLNNLLNAVKFQVAKVKDFMKDLLNE